MQIFSKNLLREREFMLVIYVDDSYLQGDSFEECFLNVLNTIEVLKSLGFTIQRKKSIFMTKQSMAYSRFVSDCIKVAVSLTHDKKKKIYSLCEGMMQKDVIIITATKMIVIKTHCQFGSSFSSSNFRSMLLQWIRKKKQRLCLDFIWTISLWFPYL